MLIILIVLLIFILLISLLFKNITGGEPYPSNITKINATIKKIRENEAIYNKELSKECKILEEELDKLTDPYKNYAAEYKQIVKKRAIANFSNELSKIEFP